MKEIHKNSFMILCIVFVFLTGLYLGYSHQLAIGKVKNVINQQPDRSPTDVADFEEFWKVWNLLNEKYPDADKVSNQERVYGAIQGLLASTQDPYTVFFPPEESKLFEEEVLGSFSGIGVEIGVKDNALVVISPLKDSPAEQAGIRAGDYFFKIDEFTVADMTLDESIKHIRGPEGTQVKITVVRPQVQQPLEFMVTRQIINIPTIAEDEIDNTYIISLYNFNSTSRELVHQALINARKKNKENIILDLRGNPGGYLDSAVAISSEFLEEGTTIVSEDYGEGKKPLVHRSRGYGTISQNTKVVILLDKGSASASEIVAGAMKDNMRATIIGETSFGKGSVQELLPVSHNTSAKITIAKWLTPNGDTISGKGITPHILVEQNPIDSSKKDITTDPTIIRALEFFKTGK